MMAWGKGCSLWDDSVDHACLAVFDYGDIPDDKFVMTTWHDGETLEEAFHFAKFWSVHPTVEVSKIIFIHIGSIEKRVEFVSAFAQVPYS